MNPVVLIIVCVGVAAAAGVAAFFLGRASKPTPRKESAEEKERVLAAARAEAEGIKKKAALDAHEIVEKGRASADSQLRERKAELERKIAEAGARAQAFERREKALKDDEAAAERKQAEIKAREGAAEAAARSAAGQLVEAKARLEKLAGLSAAEARAALEAEVREEARRAVAADVRKIEEEARLAAEQKSQMILGAAIQRYASEYVTERTVAVVPLPSDDMKGRIIGREGRNIRALEAATGIDLIIDDTPEAVVISCFNPMRREIARLALTRLIADGRIHPTRIEEMVAKAEQEIDQQCKEAGEQATFDLGIGRLNPELMRLVGQLKFRSAAGQNLLQHSIEVGFIAGGLAGELGVPVKVARRAGLLHDLGKAADQDLEGSHALAGAALAKRHGETPRVCHAIEAHHGEVPPIDVLDHIVETANILSGQRPGARRESLESYIQRLGDLEKIATGFAGVEKAFAIQAGREVRVLVENSKVSDDQARALSRDIARKMEADMSFPGQIKVAVVRETRATDYAK